MFKVKIFNTGSYRDSVELEENVNKFIKDKNVIDIKFQIFNEQAFFSCRYGYLLVLYKENKEK